MSRTNKDAPLAVRVRREGKPHVHDIFCRLDSTRVSHLTAAFRSSASRDIETFTTSLRKDRYKVAVREVSGYATLNVNAPQSIIKNNQLRFVSNAERFATNSSIRAAMLREVTDSEPHRNTAAATLESYLGPFNTRDTELRDALKNAGIAFRGFELFTVVDAMKTIKIEAQCWNERRLGGFETPDDYHLCRCEMCRGERARPADDENPSLLRAAARRAGIEGVLDLAEG